MNLVVHTDDECITSPSRRICASPGSAASPRHTSKGNQVPAVRHTELGRTGTQARRSGVLVFIVTAAFVLATVFVVVGGGASAIRGGADGSSVHSAAQDHDDTLPGFPFPHTPVQSRVFKLLTTLSMERHYPALLVGGMDQMDILAGATEEDRRSAAVPVDEWRRLKRLAREQLRSMRASGA